MTQRGHAIASHRSGIHPFSAGERRRYARVLGGRRRDSRISSRHRGVCRRSASKTDVPELPRKDPLKLLPKL